MREDQSKGGDRLKRAGIKALAMVRNPTGVATDPVDAELQNAYKHVFSKLPTATSQRTQLSQSFNNVADIRLVQTCYEKDLVRRQEYKYLKDVVRGSKTGVGSFGDVFTSTYKGRLVVEKKMVYAHTTDLIGACIFNSIDDPHLMKTYDYKFEADDQGDMVPVFVMEYCGPPLSSIWMRKEPIGKKLSIIKEIAIGLTLLHDHGVCHGDLRENNVCMHEDGRVILIDAGMVGVPNGKHFMEGTLL